MKKLLVLAFIALVSLTLSAQSTVYFGALSKKTSVGLGIDKGVVTLSLMEINKSKKFDSFSLRLYDMNGENLEFVMEEDTIYHLDMEKTWAHQKDYHMTYPEYNRLKLTLDSQSEVVIDGSRYNGAALVGILRSLEHEQTLFNDRQLPDIRKISVWTWQQQRGGMAMMRFRHPQAKGFRYVRRMGQ